jgi:K+-sensing histidine kinase KdpD
LDDELICHGLLTGSANAMQGSKWLAVCKLLREQQAKEDGVRSLLLSISHELRTPAQSGLAAAALLARRACVAADAETAFLVQAISASCGLLLGMVANVLSMRGIESGELAMHVAPFEPRAAVADVLNVCRLGRGARDIVWMDEAAPLPTETHGDRTFFCQILQNLVRLPARLRADSTR